MNWIAASTVPRRDQFKDGMRRVGVQTGIANFIDDEYHRLTVPSHHRPTAAGRGLARLLAQFAQRDKERRMSGIKRRRGKTARQMGFANLRQTEQDHIGRGGEKGQLRAAISRLWQAAPPGVHRPLWILTSG